MTTNVPNGEVQRFGLKFRPIQLIIEWRDPARDKRYHRIVRLPELTASDKPLEVGFDILEKNKALLRRDHLDQVVGLVRRLQKHLSRSRTSDEAPGERDTATVGIPGFDYANFDLNKLSTQEVQKHKDAMDKKFLQNQRDPNADDFVYDVRNNNHEMFARAPRELSYVELHGDLGCGLKNYGLSRDELETGSSWKYPKRFVRSLSAAPRGKQRSRSQGCTLPRGLTFSPSSRRNLSNVSRTAGAPSSARSTGALRPEALLAGEKKKAPRVAESPVAAAATPSSPKPPLAPGDSLVVKSPVNRTLLIAASRAELRPGSALRPSARPSSPGQSSARRTPAPGTNSPNGSPGRALPGGQSPGAAPQLKKYERYEKRNKAQSTGIHRAAFHAGASPKSVVSNVAETARTDDVKEIPTRFNARAHFAQLHSRRQELMNQLLATFTQEGSDHDRVKLTNEMLASFPDVVNAARKEKEQLNSSRSVGPHDASTVGSKGPAAGPDGFSEKAASHPGDSLANNASEKGENSLDVESFLASRRSSEALPLFTEKTKTAPSALGGDSHSIGDLTGAQVPGANASSLAQSPVVQAESERMATTNSNSCKPAASNAFAPSPTNSFRSAAAAVLSTAAVLKKPLSPVVVAEPLLVASPRPSPRTVPMQAVHIRSPRLSPQSPLRSPVRSPLRTGAVACKYSTTIQSSVMSKKAKVAVGVNAFAGRPASPKSPKASPMTPVLQSRPPALLYSPPKRPLNQDGKPPRPGAASPASPGVRLAGTPLKGTAKRTVTEPGFSLGDSSMRRLHSGQSVSESLRLNKGAAVPKTFSPASSGLRGQITQTIARTLLE